MFQPEHLSPSAISLYLACARAYRYRYVDKLRTPTAANLLFGSAYHTLVESYIGARAAGMPTKPLPELWHETWAAQCEREHEIAWGDSSSDEMIEQGEHMLTSPIEVTTAGPTRKFQTVAAFLDTIVPWTFDGRHAIELKVQLNVPGVPVPTIGYIDCITSDGMPCDFKTAARVWPADKADNELQPGIYLAALAQAGTLLSDTFRYCIFTKAKAPKVQVITTKRTPTDTMWLYGLIQDVWRSIVAGAFPPNGSGSWKCTPEYCEHYAHCRN
jgi:putative RecB family exonuclease